ncbi:hypothetical protein [Spirochaeta lutea]|uniref:Flagellar biosynthesis protein FlgN n=1 Tax=Spirochaeta lutea TaxID=1480694 RepID=A0A098QU76_9SPIO|nr:hypothetical protein [Spirochaeta lutea]KGE71274.1 hypothetical protein DC28_12610 [Spirochaeta lutea]
MTLTDRQIDQRIALLKRFRKMLEQQREKFSQYLGVLDQQEAAVQTGDTEKVAQHAMIEQEILRDILSLQKVIDPLQDMYHQAFPGGDEQIHQLQNGLERLRDQVLQRNEETRAFLHRKKQELQERIASLTIPKTKRSVYAAQSTPNLIDISL